MQLGIVVLNRNGMPHLADTLDAVCAQAAELTGRTGIGVDIVVVDGASTDGSMDELESRANVRVLDQDGLGLAQARNQGIEAVAGELIAFCDSDDVWAPGSLRCRVDHLLADIGCGGVIGALTTRALGAAAVPEHRVEGLGAAVPGYTPSALVVRRAALDAVGAFDPSLQIGADSDWFVRAVGAGIRIDVLSDVVILKGVRSASLSVDLVAYRRELLRVARAHVRRTRRSSAT